MGDTIGKPYNIMLYERIHKHASREQTIPNPQLSSGRSDDIPCTVDGGMPQRGLGEGKMGAEKLGGGTVSRLD